VDPKFQSFSLDNTETQVKYTMNIIDTPGLKEVKEKGEIVRTDEAILNTINYCLKNEITKINVLLIFISFELGITNDDLEAFRSFLEKFGHESIKIGICVTRSEDKNLRWQENIKNQLSRHEYFGEVLKKPNISLCFIGCVDPQKTSILSNVGDLRKLYVKVYQLRKKVLEIVFSAKEQVSLLELPIAKATYKTMTELLEKQSSILMFLENNKDHTTAQAQQKIDEFALGMEDVMKSEGMLADPAMFKAFTTIRERIRELKPPRMSERDFNRVRGKLIIE